MNNPEKTIATPLLEIRKLSLRYDKQKHLAVDRVSLSINPGSSLGLVGASGAGKSSIARAIVRLIEPDSGEVRFNGKNITTMDSQQLAAIRQRVQLVFQDPVVSLSPRRTVEQTLLEPLQHFAIGNTNDRNNRIREILATVGLQDNALGRFPHQFSSGQQQRIAIARALVTNPDLLIADEAVSSLDVSIQAQILQLLQELQSKFGISILFISHDLAVIRQIADNVAVMYQGQLLEQSPADQFFSQPAHPYSQTLLAIAKGITPASWPGKQWQLERSHEMDDKSSSCVFAGFCPDKMDVCARKEPALLDIQYNKQHTLDKHCVKCHLYEEVNTDDH